MSNNPDNRIRASTLAQSRFRPTRYGDEVVIRTRLFALLSELRRLTLISAPDGFGKSVLVSTWLETLDLPHTWLSLDASHSNPNLFAVYFLAAVRKLAPDIGREAHSLLISSKPAPSLIADYLIAELDGIERPMIVVLDNYHEIEGDEVHNLVGTLVQKLPRAFLLVLITRRDPPFSLTSLRAYGLLTEVRTNALRFTPAETTVFLQKTLGMQVTDETIKLLQEQAEGWIAGLHMMALHMLGQPNDRATVRYLQNVDRFATEYLALEVLGRQLPATQDFLLKTSILDRLNVPLCAAVIGANDSREVTNHLYYLHAHNLFTYEEGEQPGWYRYQRLFRQMLISQLQKRMTPEEIAVLHARASAWYASEGVIDAALAHAKTAGDMTVAVRLVAQSRHDLMNREEWHTLRRLLDMFDSDTIERYPDLLLTQAWIHLNEGHVVDYVTSLGLPGGVFATDAEPIADVHLRIEASILHCEYLYVSMKPIEAIRLANAIVEKIPPNWQTASSRLIFSLAGAYQMTGDLAQAYAVLSSALQRQRVYPSAFRVRVLAAQCMIQWIAADLPGMLHTALQVLPLSEQLHLAEMRSWADYFVGCIYYQWGELERAEKMLEPIVQQPSAVSGVVFANASCVLACTYQAQGRATDAHTITTAAVDFLRSTNSHLLPTLHAFAAELALRQGDLSMAMQWAIRDSPRFPLAPAFYNFAPQLTRPKVLLALKQPTARAEAEQLLAEASEFYRAIHHTRFLIETLVLSASLLNAAGNREDALAALEQALRMARPGGLVRVFVDAGPNLLSLLESLATRDVAPTLVSQICAAIKQGQQGKHGPGSKSMRTTGDGYRMQSADLQQAVNVRGALVEPLTNRELDVLSLMAKRITNREIASELNITSYTVKQHVGNILSKLQVSDRRRAIVRARDLGILPAAEQMS